MSIQIDDPLDIFLESYSPKFDRGYKYVVMSGGWTKSIAQLGAFSAFYNLGYMKKVTGYAGTGVSSLMVSMLACGASPEWLKNKFLGLNMNNLYNPKRSILEKIFKKEKLSNGEEIVRLVKNWLSDLGCDPQITLDGVYFTYSKTVKIGVTKLALSSGGLLEGGSLFLDHTFHGDVKLSDAIRMSMCIPCLSKPFMFDGGLCFTGNLSNSYPIKEFDNDTERRRVLGIKVVTTVGNPSNTNTSKKPIQEKQVRKIIVGAFQLSQHCGSGENDRTVYINVNGKISEDFNVKYFQKEQLWESGITAATHFLSKK